MDNLKIPAWLMVAAAVYIGALTSFAVLDGREVEFFPPVIHAVLPDDVCPIVICDDHKPPIQRPSCSSWTAEYYRLPEHPNWRRRIEARLASDEPTAEGLVGAITISGGKTDIHFWWCNDGGGTAWEVEDINANSWLNVMAISPGAKPIGFFDQRLFYLVPKR